MNNQIKEILGILRRCTYGNEVYLIKEHGATLLLDYITNLQHTEDLYNQLLKDYDELQQENERLKKQLEYLRTDEYLNQVKWERNFNETMNKELKTRIEKAVEYIEHSKFIKEQVIMKSNYDMQDFQIRELLNILNGKE